MPTGLLVLSAVAALIRQGLEGVLQMVSEEIAARTKLDQAAELLSGGAVGKAVETGG